MAGEAAHVVYGARLVSHLANKVKGTSFWAGTLFPDIRHLGVTSRQHTHASRLSLQDLTGANDFDTGMRVHAWLDENRNKFLDQHNIKEELPWHPFVPHALKLVEDEWLYDRFEDWTLIHRALNRVYDEEVKLVHSPKHIIRWHQILQDYLRQKPNDATRHHLTVDIGLSTTNAEEINLIVANLKKNPRVKSLTDQFIHWLENLLR